MFCWLESVYFLCMVACGTLILVPKDGASCLWLTVYFSRESLGFAGLADKGKNPESLQCLLWSALKAVS